MWIRTCPSIFATFILGTNIGLKHISIKYISPPQDAKDSCFTYELIHQVTLFDIVRIEYDLMKYYQLIPCFTLGI